MNQNSKYPEWHDINSFKSTVSHYKDGSSVLFHFFPEVLVDCMIPFMKAALTEKVLKTLERLLVDSKKNLEWSEEEVCWIGPQYELETYWSLHFVFEAIKYWHTISENNYDERGNENKRWSKEEECYLKAAFTTRRPISEIAEDLMRTERAIHSRLNLLGYYVPQIRY